MWRRGRLRAAARVGAILVVAAASAGGCSRRQHGREGADSTSIRHPVGSSAPVADTSAIDERPRALLGPPIGSRDSLMRVIAPQLAAWVTLWRAADPRFRLDSLRSEGLATFALQWDAQPFSIAGITAPAESLPADQRDDQGLLALTLVAPGARHALVIDRYQDIGEGEGGSSEIGGEPDSAPMIVERKTGRTATFAFCGTGCGYQWGAWIDSSRFVIAGWSEADSRSQRFYGKLDFYDLTRGRSATYYAPVVTGEDYERYESAWHDWVAARRRRIYGPRKNPS